LYRYGGGTTGVARFEGVGLRKALLGGLAIDEARSIRRGADWDRGALETPEGIRVRERSVSA
jgi:hypothetical protein